MRLCGSNKEKSREIQNIHKIRPEESSGRVNVDVNEV